MSLNNFNLEEMSQCFDVRADGYDEHMKNNVVDFEAFYRTVAEQVKETQNEVNILDLGCGTGLELEGIFKRAPKSMITGIDMSDNMLSKLKVKYKSHEEQITLYRDSYITRPFEKENYDYVVSVMTMHHFLYEVKLGLYKKIHEALAPEGRYIEGDYIGTPDEELYYLSEYHKKMDSLGDEEKKLYHIDIPFSIETQTKLFLEAGFKNVEVVWDKGSDAVFVARK